MPTAYRAVVTQPSHVEIESYPVPAPAEGQLLIQTHLTLISPGTERAFFLALPNAKQPFPFYPGYSNVGHVVAVGENVQGFKEGDMVISTGNHASHIVMNAAQCLPIPAGVREEDAVFFNLIAIAMQAIHKARIELGESVIVIGAGMIGLFAMQLAKLSGGLPVTTIDLDANRLKLAQELGADNIHQPTTYEGQANVIIEATGAPPAIKGALEWAAQRGRILLLGSSRGETDGINFYRDVHRKGISIIGAHEINRPKMDNAAGFWRQIDEHRIALELLARQRLNVQPMITHRFRSEDFPEAYNLLSAGDALGMLIQW